MNPNEAKYWMQQVAAPADADFQLRNPSWILAAARLEAEIESRRSVSTRLGWIDTTTKIGSAAAIAVVAFWIVPILSALE